MASCKEMRFRSLMIFFLYGWRYMLLFRGIQFVFFDRLMYKIKESLEFSTRLFINEILKGVLMNDLNSTYRITDLAASDRPRERYSRNSLCSRSQRRLSARLSTGIAGQSTRR